MCIYTIPPTLRLPGFDGLSFSMRQGSPFFHRWHDRFWMLGDAGKTTPWEGGGRERGAGVEPVTFGVTRSGKKGEEGRERERGGREESITEFLKFC